jgi:cytochrome b6-f complex iron-sulfur subunit
MATESSQPPGRRSFLWYVLFCLGSLLAAATTWGVGRFALFATGTKRTRQIAADVVATLEPGSPVHVASAGVWLLKPAQGDEPLALDDRCTHLGCAVAWNAQRSLFECPCHGSEFDGTGQVNHGPATRSLSRFSLNRGEDGTLRLVEKPPEGAAPS